MNGIQIGAAALAVLSIALFGLAVGGEMKPTGQCYSTYPPGYVHVCGKCGTKAVYNVCYPEIRYVTE